MLTQELLQSKGFIVVDNDIEELTYKEYLHSYGADETTTPKGIAPRMHIRERDTCIYENTTTGERITEDEYWLLDEEDREEYSYIGNIPKYELWTWGTGGNYPQKISSFDSYEDAELELYSYFQWYVKEHNWNAPVFFDSFDEAVAELAQLRDRDCEVIKRFLKIQRIAQIKEKEREEKAERERKARKELKMQMAQQEADSIIIDDEYCKAVAWADEVSGMERNNRHASALKGLLQRVGKGKIESDFWQVQRILKARARDILSRPANS
jgi:hypothetical protein